MAPQGTFLHTPQVFSDWAGGSLKKGLLSTWPRAPGVITNLWGSTASSVNLGQRQLYLLSTPLPGCCSKCFRVLTHSFPQPFAMCVIVSSVCRMGKLKHREGKAQNAVARVTAHSFFSPVPGRVEYTFAIKTYFFFFLLTRNIYLLLYATI